MTANNELHPTPQLARPEWDDLGGAWDFAFDDDNVGLTQHWETDAAPFNRKIIVPFAPESAASGLHETGFHPYIWYRRTLSVDSRAGQQLWLHFGAVDYRARVWVNGQLVAQHEGGHTPFAADITSVLNDGAEQVIVVRAEDQPLDRSQPRGKQDWELEPHIIWYHRTSGIWQPVWLEWKSPVHIQEIRWTPDAYQASFGVAVRLSAVPRQPARIRLQLSLRGNVLVEDSYLAQGQMTERTIRLPIEQLSNMWFEVLWSPELPNLIDAVVSVEMDGDTVDKVYSYAGLRSAEVRDGRFYLNNHPYFLRTVLEQGYWPESLLTAPTPDALRREVELIKELGFNGARIHQKVEDPRFLYWCDRLGLIIWGEMANSYQFNADSADRLTREWLEVIKRDYSHPCIVTWVPVNESWGVPALKHDERQREFLKALYSLTKTFDTTRPVIDNDGWEHMATDIITIHDYNANGETLHERYGTEAGLREILTTGRPLHHKTLLDGHQVDMDTTIMITEFGGISYAPKPGERWYGYATVATAEEYLDKIDELVRALVNSPAVAGFCYTQLTDTEQETNGVLLENREPKVDMERLRTIFQQRRIGN